MSTIQQCMFFLKNHCFFKLVCYTKNCYRWPTSITFCKKHHERARKVHETLTDPTMPTKRKELTMDTLSLSIFIHCFKHFNDRSNGHSLFQRLNSS